MSARLTAVVCATYQQFRNWCIENDRDPRDPSLHLVTVLRHAHGFRFDKVVAVDQREPGLIAATRSRLRTEG
jgi:hypothetical protein